MPQIVSYSHKFPVDYAIDDGSANKAFPPLPQAFFKPGVGFPQVPDSIMAEKGIDHECYGNYSNSIDNLTKLNVPQDFS
jgi:hypothetical protein